MATMTIDEALTLFLDAQRERLAPRTFRNYDDVIGLLRDCMNGYGHDLLSEADHDRWQRAYDNGDEDAFCTQMDASYIDSMLGEFLGYFMIRKVMAGQELLQASGTVTKKLVGWLAEHGVIDQAAAASGTERATEAAHALPKAARLADALHQLTLDCPVRSPETAERWIEDDIPMQITEVAPGKLWFQGDIGPLTVPRKVSELAQTGWSVTVVLAFARNRWWLVEVGNVYPS
jgi:hypothetical protein